ncbi:hypothetical protein ABPG72_010205 [Tetrahymena utriculariae]
MGNNCFKQGQEKDNQVVKKNFRGQKFIENYNKQFPDPKNEQNIENSQAQTNSNNLSFTQTIQNEKSRKKRNIKSISIQRNNLITDSLIQDNDNNKIQLLQQQEILKKDPDQLYVEEQLKRLLNPKIYLPDLLLDEETEQDNLLDEIKFIKESDAFIIQKLTQSFKENRFQKCNIDYIQSIAIYNMMVSKICKKEFSLNDINVVSFEFDQLGFTSACYFDSFKKTLFNVYTFLNQKNFNLAVQINEKKQLLKKNFEGFNCEETYTQMIENFVNNKNYQEKGITQKQVVEYFQQYFGNDVLQHFPVLNNSFVEIFIEDFQLDQDEKQLTSETNMYLKYLFPGYYGLIQEIIDKNKSSISKQQLNKLMESSKYNNAFLREDEKFDGFSDSQIDFSSIQFNKALKNLSSLLYIDISPIILQEYGMTKEFQVQPYNNVFEYQFNIESLDKHLLRPDNFLYQANDYCQHNIDNFIKKINEMRLFFTNQFYDFTQQKNKQINELLSKKGHLKVLSINSLLEILNTLNQKNQADNVARYFLIKNPNLIEQYSQIDLTSNTKQSQYFTFDEYQAKIRQFKENNGQPLFQSSLSYDNQKPLFKQNQTKWFQNLLYQKYNFLQIKYEQDQGQNNYAQEKKQIDLELEEQKQENDKSIQELQTYDKSNEQYETEQYNFKQLEIEYDNTFDYLLIKQEEKKYLKTITYNKMKKLFQNNLNQQLFDQQMNYQQQDFQNRCQHTNQNNEYELNDKKISSQEEFQQQKSTLIEIDLLKNEEETKIDNKQKLEIQQTQEEEEKEEKEFENNIKVNKQIDIEKEQKHKILLEGFVFNDGCIILQNDQSRATLYEIGKLGNGGFGLVTFLNDFDNKQQYAMKTFSTSQEYQQEKNFHLNYLQQEINPTLASYVCLLKSYNDSNKQLLFEIGICSLQEANLIYIQERITFNFDYLREILKQIVSFNIQMNKVNLYHGDIKPQNIVIYQDQAEIKAQQLHAIQLNSSNLIQIKFIDFGTSSDNCEQYYDYYSKKYKYLEYYEKGTEMNFEKILYAETYSACKIIYFLLNESQKQEIQSIKCDLNAINIVNYQENSVKNGLFTFLAFFLGKNQVQNQLSEYGLSFDNLFQLAKIFLGEINELNEFICQDYLNLLKKEQFKKITEVKYNLEIKSEQYFIFSAFALKNNLFIKFDDLTDKESIKIFKAMKLLIEYDQPQSNLQQKNLVNTIIDDLQQQSSQISKNNLSLLFEFVLTYLLVNIQQEKEEEIKNDIFFKQV